MFRADGLQGYYYDAAPRRGPAAGQPAHGGSLRVRQAQPAAWQPDGVAPSMAAAAANSTRLPNIVRSSSLSLQQTSPPRAVSMYAGEPYHVDPYGVESPKSALLRRQAVERAEQQARLESTIEQALELRRRHDQEEALLLQSEQSGPSTPTAAAAAAAAAAASPPPDPNTSHYQRLLMQEFDDVRRTEAALLPAIASPTRTSPTRKSPTRRQPSARSNANT